MRREDEEADGKEYDEDDDDNKKEDELELEEEEEEDVEEQNKDDGTAAAVAARGVSSDGSWSNDSGSSSTAVVEYSATSADLFIIGSGALMTATGRGILIILRGSWPSIAATRARSFFTFDAKFMDPIDRMNSSHLSSACR